MNPWNDSDGFALEAAKVESAGEALLLSLLWWRRNGWTVRAQEPIEQYRIDLFVPEAGVAIEVDSLAGHGSNEAMERDARKRNLVVSRGWAPLTFSAQQAVFATHDALVEAVAVIEGRLPRPAAPSRLRQADIATGAASVLAGISGRPEPLVLSASQRALANLPLLQRLGVELLLVVLDAPALVREPIIRGALALADGPVALAAAALAESLAPGGHIDRGAFLRTCPALLQPLAAARLDAPGDASTAPSRALALASQIGGA